MFSSTWLNYLVQDLDSITGSDWFLLVSSIRFLSTMCSYANYTIQKSIDEFLADQFISFETLDIELFNKQIQLEITGFVEQIITRFRRVQYFITETLRSNQFYSIYNTNWQSAFSTLEEEYYLRSTPINYNNGSCRCASGMSNCSRSLFLLDQNATYGDVFDEFVSGCLPIDGFRQSKLSCFFNRSCSEKLTSMRSVYFPLLQQNFTRFPLNTTTMGILMDELFIEYWSNTSNYSTYFNSCAPSLCQYSYISRSNIIYIITILLGLYGGLTVALRSLVWYGIALFRWIFSCQRTTLVVPLTTQ